MDVAWILEHSIFPVWTLANVKPVPVISTEEVPGAVSKAVKNLNLLSVASLNKPAYFVPLLIYLPYTPISSVSSLVFAANCSKESSATISLTLIVVVVPLTVKFPATITSPFTSNKALGFVIPIPT